MNVLDMLLNGPSNYNPYTPGLHNPLWLHGEDHIASQLIEKINEWYNEIAQSAQKLSEDHPDHPDLSSECEIAVLRKMARGQVIIATVAPLIETILFRVGHELKKMESKITRENSNKRWQCTDGDIKFNPKKYIEDGGSHKDNIIDGPWQLLNAIGQFDKISNESRRFQLFTFRYRNYSLHNGYYWDSESLSKMMSYITEKTWDNWVEKVTSNDDLLMITLSDQYVHGCISSISKLVDEYVSVLASVYET